MFHTDSIYLMLFVSGFLGGFGHCIGMCGPVVAVYSLHTGTLSRTIPHILYNLGRIITYSLLGGIMGMAGSFTGVVSSIEKYQNIVLALVGAAMAIMGLSISGWFPFVKRIEHARLSRGLASAVRFIADTKTDGAYFPMGLVLGFMPCGLLYTALIGAAGTGVEAKNQIEGFARGMSSMFLFGIGTFPAMFLLGRLVSLKGEWVRNKFYRGSAIMMIIIGAVLIYRALRY